MATTRLSVIIGLAAITAVGPASAGQYELSWSYLFDGAGYSESLEDMVVDAQRNVIVTGESPSDAVFAEDIVTIKLDALGTPLWTAVYDGPSGRSDRGLGVALGPGGSVYVAGQSDGGDSGLDIVTIRYSRDGAEQWVARYTHPFNSLDRGTDIAVDRQGNAFVTGYSHAGGCCEYHYTTIAYDRFGNELWVAHHESGDGLAWALALDSQGNPVVTGYDEFTYGTIKYDGATGEQLWYARYDAGFGDEPFDVALDVNDNVYVTGGSGTSHAGYLVDWVTIKYDPDGQQVWLQRYDGPAGTLDEPTALAVDSANGRVVVTGYTQGIGTAADATTVSYDAGTGELLWDARIDGPASGSDFGEDVAIDARGAVYVTGDIVTTGSGIRQQFIVRYSPQGGARFRARFGEPGEYFYGRQIRVVGLGRAVYTGGIAAGDYSVLRYDRIPIQDP